jgi:hypothetical protein
MCTYKGGICNIKSRRVMTSYDTQEHKHWNKVDNECVATPGADLKWPVHDYSIHSKRAFQN